MLITALGVGLVVAFYFGLRAGGVAAATSFVLLLVAMLVPSARWPAYGVLFAGVGVACAIGARKKDPTQVAKAFRWGRRAVAEAKRRLGLKK